MRKMQYILMPLEKEQRRHWITVLSNLGELSGRLHSYTDGVLYILALVIELLEFLVCKCQKMRSMPDKQANATVSMEHLAA